MFWTKRAQYAFVVQCFYNNCNVMGKVVMSENNTLMIVSADMKNEEFPQNRLELKFETR